VRALFPVSPSPQAGGPTDLSGWGHRSAIGPAYTIRSVPFARWFSRNKDRASAGTDAFGNPLGDDEGPTVVGGLGGTVAGGVDAGAQSQPGRVVLREFFHDEFAVAAVVLGINRGELARRLHQGEGRSIAEVAADAGVARQTIIDAVVRDTTTRLDTQAANGTISASEAEEAKSRVPAWAIGFADRQRPDPGTSPGGG
jgi:hypothetical protein